MDAIIGIVYTSLAKYGEAETFLARALELQRDQHGPNHPEALETMQAMARLALRRGKNENAEPLLRDVLARRLEQPHPDPMLIASTQNDLGVALERLGRSDEHTSELQSLMRTSYAV